MQFHKPAVHQRLPPYRRLRIDTQYKHLPTACLPPYRRLRIGDAAYSSKTQSLPPYRQLRIGSSGISSNNSSLPPYRRLSVPLHKRGCNNTASFYVSMMTMVITASINHSYGLATSACPIANNFSVLLKF